MKNLLIATVVLCCFSQICSIKFCFNRCVNIIDDAICSMIAINKGCGQKMKIFCALSCKVCTQCKPGGELAASNEASSRKASCEIEGCDDKASPQTCSLIKNLFNCSYLPESCRRSCGECKPCLIPPPACVSNCEDYHDSCEPWASHGYCMESSEYFPFMSQKCPKSCGICKLCPTTEPPNRDLPPTPLSCSEDCVDLREKLCAHWTSLGYCLQIEKYPRLRKVCAFSCGACFPCSTSQCSKDCLDTHENCENWKESGYCVATEGQYSETRELCPRSCGVCTACSKETEDDRSTELPPF